MPLRFLIRSVLVPSISFLGLSCIQAESPNIVFVLTDDQGWGATSVLMDEDLPESRSDFIKTPNLEKLASRGMVFSQGYAPHPNCSPSRYSILTGKSPALLQMSDIVGRHRGPFYEGNRIIPPPHVNDIADEEITIAEWIKQHRPEYATAHFGKWHINGEGPERHGFDASSGETGNAQGKRDDPDPKRIFSITERGNEWMEQQVELGRPFYLQLSHYATHLAVFSKRATLEETQAREPGKRHNQADYAAMAQDLDTGLGMTLEKIQQLGIEDNTYVVFLADNGSYPLPNPGNTNGPLHGWKATLWEGGIRVPFIVAGPGISRGRSREMVVGYDLFPTISDWLRVGSVPDGLEGGSLAKVLSGEAGARVERANPFLVFHFPHYQLQKGGQPSTTLHQGDFKLIKFWETGDYHLYNLRKDLEERENLAKTDTNRTVRMSLLLEAYLRSINAGIPTVNTQFDAKKDPGKKWEDIKARLVEEPYFIVP